MIPAFIPFVFASLAGIVALLVFPIVVSTRILAGDHPIRDRDFFVYLVGIIGTSKYKDLAFKTADWNRNR